MPKDNLRMKIQHNVTQIIDALKKHRSEIAEKQAQFDGTKSSKDLILSKIDAIDVKMIKENVHIEKKLLYLIKIKEKMDNTHIRHKKLALERLMKALKLNVNFDRQHEQALEAIRKQMADIQGWVYFIAKLEKIWCQK